MKKNHKCNNANAAQNKHKSFRFMAEICMIFVAFLKQRTEIWCNLVHSECNFDAMPTVNVYVNFVRSLSTRLNCLSASIKNVLTLSFWTRLIHFTVFLLVFFLYNCWGHNYLNFDQMSIAKRRTRKRNRVNSFARPLNKWQEVGIFFLKKRSRLTLD